MGKKATFFLLHVIVVGVTLVLALLAAGGFIASYISPYESALTPLLGLALPISLIMSAGLFVFWVVQWRYWAWVSLVAILLNLKFLLAMFQFLPAKPANELNRSFTIVTYNVHNFNGSAYREDVYRRVAAELGEYLGALGADIICMQEFTEIKPFPIDSVAKALGMEFAAVPKNREGLDLAVFSKYRISEASVLTLDDSKYSTGVSMFVDIDVPGGPVRVFNNHMQTTNVNATRQFFDRQVHARNAKGAIQAAILISRIMNMNFKLRATQAERIRREIDASPYPVVVCGDMNDTPASYTYRTLRGDLVDGFKQVGKGYGYTFKEFKKLLRIDYVFYSGSIKGLDYRSDNKPWSDHKPVMMELRVE